MECSVFRCFIPVSGQWCVHSGVAKGPQVRIEIMTSFLFSHTHTLSETTPFITTSPLSLSLSIATSRYPSVCLSLGLSLPSIATSILCLSLSPPLSFVSRHLSLSRYISLSTSVPCLSLYLSLSIYLSLTPPLSISPLLSQSPKVTLT